MPSTIEETARAYVESADTWSYGCEENHDITKQMYESFKAGANYVYEFPLSERLTTEEKERIRKIHMESKWLYEKHKDSVFKFAEVYKGQYELLESILGKEFFIQ